MCSKSEDISRRESSLPLHKERSCRHPCGHDRDAAGVRLMLDRLEADLATDEVSLSMAAFQVLAWLSRSKENMLRKHVAVLGQCLVRH